MLNLSTSRAVLEFSFMPGCTVIKVYLPCYAWSSCAEQDCMQYWYLLTPLRIFLDGTRLPYCWFLTKPVLNSISTLLWATSCYSFTFSLWQVTKLPPPRGNWVDLVQLHQWWVWVENFELRIWVGLRNHNPAWNLVGAWVETSGNLVQPQAGPGPIYKHIIISYIYGCV